MKTRLVVSAAALSFALLSGGASSCGDTSSSSSSDKPSPSQSPPPSQQKSKPKVNAKPQYYSGAGDKNLGTVVVPVDSTLTWTNGKSLGQPSNFLITNDFSDENTIDVNAIGTHDTTQVSAGTYHKVDVLGTNWKMQIVPNK